MLIMLSARWETDIFVGKGTDLSAQITRKARWPMRGAAQAEALFWRSRFLVARLSGRASTRRGTKRDHAMASFKHFLSSLAVAALFILYLSSGA